MADRKPVRVGMISAGFLAETRARGYAQVSGYDVQIVAVAARTEGSARKYAAHYGVPHVFTDYNELLALPDVGVVDLCIPNHLHRPVTEAAAAAQASTSSVRNPSPPTWARTSHRTPATRRLQGRTGKQCWR